MADSIVAGVLRVNGWLVIQRHDEDGMTTWSRVVTLLSGSEITLVLVMSEVLDRATLTAQVKGSDTATTIQEDTIAEVASTAVAWAHQLVTS